MTSRERIRAIINGEASDRCGFWLGQPTAEAWPLYRNHFGAGSGEEVRRKLGCDLRWIMAGTYKHPEGKPMFDYWATPDGGKGVPVSQCQDVDALDVYAWPNPDYMDFSETIKELDAAGEHYRASGLWTPFYHDCMFFFGMETYLVNMCINPDIVHAITDRICEFYYEVNGRFFEAAGDRVDGYFFGNDFGTQQSLICTPGQFDEFIMPWLRKFTDLGHAYGKQIILHSCGAIHDVIGLLIDAGVDCLHPLQAKATAMDAGALAKDFKGRIAFMGGIDTQDLLINGTPEDIKADVRRVKALLGPNLIVSPSHEALQNDVPPENVRAMADAARE